MSDRPWAAGATPARSGTSGVAPDGVKLGYSWYVVGVLVLAQTYSFLDRMIMGLPLARSTDAKSRRNLIAIGIAVWSAMTALCGLAKGFWTLFAARMGVTFGSGLTYMLGGAVVAMATDYVFGYDAAVGLSIALCGGVLCPLGAFILWRGLPGIRELLVAQLSAMSDTPELDPRGDQ